MPRGPLLALILSVRLGAAAVLSPAAPRFAARPGAAHVGIASSTAKDGRLGSVGGHGVDVAEAARACAAPVIGAHRRHVVRMEPSILGYVRRRDRARVADFVAAAAGRTMREVIPTAFVAVRTMWAA